MKSNEVYLKIQQSLRETKRRGKRSRKRRSPGQLIEETGREEQASDNDSSNVDEAGDDEARRDRQASNDEAGNDESRNDVINDANVDRRTSIGIMEGTTVLQNVSFPQSVSVETPIVENAIGNQEVVVVGKNSESTTAPRRTKRNKTTKLAVKR
jgi:hypothetical protein